MNIVFAADRGYLPHLSVAMLSLAKSMRVPCKIHVITSDISDHDWSRLCSPRVFSRHSLARHTVDDTHLRDLAMGKHFKVSSYYRLLIPDLIKADRAIYLDADIVVNDDLTFLRDVDLGQHCIAAVEDPIPNGAGGYDGLGLGMSSTSHYFNSGVLVMDLVRWRSMDVSRRAFDFARSHAQALRFVDQCALNGVLDGVWQPLPARFNCMGPFFTGNIPEDYRDRNRTSLLDAIQNPAVIHFTGAVKPWHFACKHPKKPLYWRHLHESPYRFWLPMGISVRSLARRTLERLGCLRT